VIGLDYIVGTNPIGTAYNLGPPVQLADWPVYSSAKFMVAIGSDLTELRRSISRHVGKAEWHHSNITKCDINPFPPEEL
jgi:hypothetical protein